MIIKPISLQQAEYIAHALAKELMDSDHEPIPPFNTRFPGKLESCLATPFVTYDGKYLYRTFNQRAAILFYLLIKNHCFENGNKRMAVVLTVLFCYTNRRWLDVSPVELYEIACDVAKSDPKDKEIMLAALKKFFKIKMITSDQAQTMYKDKSS